MSGRRLGAAALLLLSAVSALFSWDISSSYSVDWVERTVSIDIAARREAGDPVLPAARLAAMSAVERALPLICLETASQIAADSRRSLGDIMETDTSVLSSLGELYRKAEEGAGSFTGDLSGLRVRYTFRLYPDLVEDLVRHERPYIPERRLDWEPTGPFTGIIIYARGDLPEHGKESTARLRPCLLPRIYDENMELISAPYMTDPDILRTLGPVAYAYSLADRRIRNRVGYYPMRIAAGSVFGTRPTDPVIPLEWADKIRSSRDIQRLIAEGKIVFVIDPPQPAPPASAGP